MDSAEQFIRDRIAESQKTRFAFLGSYKVDRWLVNGCFAFLLLYFFLLGNSQHWQLDYYRCGAVYPEQCKNPFYDAGLIWKTAEFLPAGEYGNPAALSIDHYVSYGAWGIFALGFLANHILHNRRRKHGTE